MEAKTFTAEPWQAERGFTDAFSHTTGHYTVNDQFITIYCGEEAIDSNGDEPIDLIEVHGPNQEANARLVEAAPVMFKAVAGLPDLLDQPIQWVSALLAEYNRLLEMAKEMGYEEEDPDSRSTMQGEVRRLIDGVNAAIKQASDPALFK